VPIASGDMHMFDFFGDCIGLSPIIFGEEDAYVQSDMQFAQQVQEEIREYSDHLDTGEIDANISMDLMSRFFIRESTSAEGEVESKMVASEIHLEVSSVLKAIK